MKMKFSLLYKEAEPLNHCDVVYDLSVDRAVHYIYKDIRRADYFLSVVMKPLRKIENIIFRQDILKDFIETPRLFDDLKVIFNRYDKVKSDWRELRSGAYPAGGTVNQRALLEYTFASLKVTAIFPKTIISFFSSIRETLSKHEIKSEGLRQFEKYCAEMIENNSLLEVARIASLFQYHSPENFDFTISALFDETLKLKSCDLCELSEHETETNNPLKKFFAKKKTADSFSEVEPDEGETIDDTIFLLNESLHNIDNLLTHITNDVYEIFYGISAELQFYEAALSIDRYFKDNEMSFEFPKILPMDSDIFKASDIYDILLLSEGLTRNDIILNDVDFSDCGGMLIKGLNKTGKTSYLRAIGISQLFAQAGLPICARNAEVSVRNAVFTHFSSAEEDFKVGDTAGRFESEVQLISKIVDDVIPYSLILLNETFQTTAYNEGTEGIFNILSFMPKLYTKFIFVTRLNGLFEMMKDMNVRFIETGYDENSYKIFDVKPQKE